MTPPLSVDLNRVSTQYNFIFHDGGDFKIANCSLILTCVLSITLFISHGDICLLITAHSVWGQRDEHLDGFGKGSQIIFFFSYFLNLHF